MREWSGGRALAALACGVLLLIGCGQPAGEAARSQLDLGPVDQGTSWGTDTALPEGDLAADLGPPEPAVDLGPGGPDLASDLGPGTPDATDLSTTMDLDFHPEDLRPADDGIPADGGPRCPVPLEWCADECLPPCSAPTIRGAECRCEDSEPLPTPTGPMLGDTLCISDRIPLGDSPAQVAFREFFFAQLARTGIRLVRTHFVWAELEPHPGELRLDSADRQVAEAEAHGVRLIGLLGYGNAWASVQGAAQADHYYPPDDPQDFARYAAVLAGRYVERVTRWEIWNEQNAGYRFWKVPGQLGGDPAAYARLLQVTGLAIREVAPAAQISFGGLFYIPQFIPGAEDFLEQSYAAVPELGGAFDTVSYHPYALYPPRDPPEHDAELGQGVHVYTVDETARRLHGIVTTHEGRGKPLWITELGWPTEHAVSELDQARFLVRGWFLALSTGLVDTYCIYDFMDGSPERDYLAPWERVFGLHAWDGDLTDGTLPRAKPAVDALATLAATLGSLRFLGDERTRIVLPAPVYVHSFGAEGAEPPGPGMLRRVRAAWSTAGEAEIRLPVLAGVEVLQQEFLGGPPRAVEREPDGWLRITVGPSPVYVLERIPSDR